MNIRMNEHTLVLCQLVVRQREAHTYRRITLKMIRRLKWKMLAMPKANPRTMHKTPALQVFRQNVLS